MYGITLDNVTDVMETLVQHHSNHDSYDDSLYGLIYAPDYVSSPTAYDSQNRFIHVMEKSLTVQVEGTFEVVFRRKWGDRCEWSSETILEHNTLHGRHRPIETYLTEVVPLAVGVFTETDLNLLHMCLTEVRNLRLQDMYFYQYHWSNTQNLPYKVHVDNVERALNELLRHGKIVKEEPEREFK